MSRAHAPSSREARTAASTSANTTFSRRAWLSLAAAPLMACAAPPPLVLFVHAGDAAATANAETLAAIREVLAARQLQFEVKQLPIGAGPAADVEAAAQLAQEITERNPNLVMVWGDDVMSRLVAPYLRGGPIPVVYGGVQWAATPYGVPNHFVTGIVETPPVQDTILLAKTKKPEAKDLFVLAGDTPDIRRNRVYLDPVYWRNKLSTTYGLVSNFESWKKAFRWANNNNKAELIFLVSNRGIADWDEEAAKQHITEHLRIPVFTCDAQLMPYAVVGRVNDRREQGEWMGQQAQLILDGTSPGEIRGAQTKRSQVLHNAALAEKIGFVLPEQKG